MAYRMLYPSHLAQSRHSLRSAGWDEGRSAYGRIRATELSNMLAQQLHKLLKHAVDGRRHWAAGVHANEEAMAPLGFLELHHRPSPAACEGQHITSVLWLSTGL